MSRSTLDCSKWILAVCAPWFLAGCVETGIMQVVSKTDGSSVSTSKRFLVVSQVAWVDKTWTEPFEKAILFEFKHAGVRCGVQSRNPLALQADKVKYTTEIAEYKPDFVLVVEPGDGTADEKGRNLMRRFEAGLFRNYTERNRRELIWRATIPFEPSGPTIKSDDMPALARKLVARLKADGIFPKPKARREAGKSPPLITKPLTPLISW